MRATATTSLLVGLLLVLLPGTALAHASFDLRQVPAGSTQDLELRVPLERDADNDLVEVLVPAGFTVTACPGAEGWACEQAETADGDTVVALRRAADGAGDTERFAITVEVPTMEGVYAFPTIQTYDDGEEASWIGEDGGDQPAPRIQVGDETAPVESSGASTPHTDLAGPDEDTTASAEPSSATTPSPSPDAATDEPVAQDDEPAAPAAADGGVSPALVAVGLRLAAGVLAGAVARFRAR